VKRSHRLLVALAAVLVLVWLLVRQRGDPHVDAQPTPASAVTRSEPVDVHAPETTPAATNEDVRTAVDTPASEAPLAAPSADAKPTPPAAWGRVLVIEEDGRETLAGDGVLSVSLRDGSLFGSGDRAVVRAGVWRLDFSDPLKARMTKLRFNSALVDKRFMNVESPTAEVAFVAARDLDVRIRRPARSLLRVIDAATNLDLPAVTLVQPLARTYQQHPGPDFEPRIVIRARASPLEIDDLSDVEFAQSVRVHVGAPGLAWQLHHHDLAQGGERVIALVAGADLSLVVRGVEPGSDSMLRIRRPETRDLIFECALTRDDTLDIGGLPAGALTVSAEIGSGRTLEPVKLAELSLELAPAMTNKAELVLSAAPKFSTAAVRGTLYIPLEWASAESDDPLLDLRSLSGAHIDRDNGVIAQCSRGESKRAGFDAFHFSFDAAPVGRCEWVLWGNPDFRGVIDVPPAGLEGLELVMPHPVELEFEVRDAETGERVADARLGWQGPRPSGIDDRGFSLTAPDADGVHRVRAPAYEIKLKTLTDDYEPYEENLRVAPGAPRRIVRLKRPCSIEVKLRAGGATLPPPRRWSATPTAIGGNGETLTKVRREDALVLMVSTPGTYEVSPDPIPGYRTPAPQRVEVQRGAPVSIEFVYEVERP
jgi:hypothetical protein